MNADFYRLWRTKSFYICTAVSAVMAIFNVIIIQAARSILNSTKSTDVSVKASQTAFDEITRSGGIGRLVECMSGNLIPLLIAIVISLFVCIEFSSGAIKNAHGFNRSEIYFSTLLTAAISALIMTLVYMLASFAAGSIAWGIGQTDSNTVPTMLKVLGTEFLVVIACVSFFVMAAMIIRNSGGTIAVNLGSIIIIPLILQIIGILINIVAKYSDIVLDKYWVVSAGTAIATLKPAGNDIITALIVAGCYIVITTLLGVYTFQKRDIK